MNSSERLKDGYSRELSYFRQLAVDFHARYPSVGGRLGLDAEGKTTDPHVERMIEAFALLTANVQVKLDDEFPELTDALLTVLYPHYVAPLPSMSIVQLTLNAGASDSPNGYTLPRHTLMKTNRVNDVECQYRTGYATTIWPLAVIEAKLREPPWEGYEPPHEVRSAARSFLRIRIRRTSNLPLEELSLDALRFYILGTSQLPVDLYEMLFTEAVWIQFRSTERRKVVYECKAKDVLRQVGFDPEEALLPYPKQSFAGYRLLTEFFAYPSRFSFFDLGGWQAARAAGLSGDAVEVVIYFNRVPREGLVEGVQRESFATGAVPVINLFERPVEAFPLTHEKTEYRVEPDIQSPGGYEIYSIDSVVSIDTKTGGQRPYRPFYSFEHGNTSGVAPYWYASRRPRVLSKVSDGQYDLENSVGTDVYLRFADQALDPQQPADESITIRATCLNRDLPTKLREAREGLQFELMAAAPMEVKCLKPPTVTLRPPSQRRSFWRLLSHLNLNHLSLTDGEQGLHAIREYLRLYDFADAKTDLQLSAMAGQVVEGLLSVTSKRVTRFTGTGAAGGFARGIAIDIHLSDEKFTGVGGYLFASVLERFLALYASINSFVQLTATTDRRDTQPWTWTARAGEQVLL